MITFQRKKDNPNLGLGNQISYYIMMRSISIKRGFDWVITNSELKYLRNTFENLNLNINSEFEPFINEVEFDNNVGFESICNGVIDEHMVRVHPTPVNYYSDIYDQVKSELIFKQDIKAKCEEFKSQFGGEVIGMHIRAGDFEDIFNGMFLCDYDYYENALAELPADLPVLVFSDNKTRAKQIISKLSYDASRFTIVNDIYQNNQGSDSHMERIDHLMDYDGTYKHDYNIYFLHQAGINLNIKGIQNPNIDQINQEVKDIVNSLDSTSKTKVITGKYNYSYDFCLMSMCEYIIMGNSTYSMFAAQLGNPIKVMYPKYWIQISDAQDITQTIIRDYGGENQILDLAEFIFGNDNYYPVENPDHRTITVVE